MADKVERQWGRCVRDLATPELAAHVFESAGCSAAEAGAGGAPQPTRPGSGHRRQEDDTDDALQAGPTPPWRWRNGCPGWRGAATTPKLGGWIPFYVPSRAPKALAPTGVAACARVSAIVHNPVKPIAKKQKELFCVLLQYTFALILS